MTRLNAVLALLALLLAAAVALEWRQPGGDTLTIQASSRPSPGATRPAPLPQAPPSQREEWVETILARPLFSSTRRPDQQVARPGPAAAPAAPLPRVTGILVDGRDRRAILVGKGEARPVVVGEGDQVEGLLVDSIEAGRVTLVGPEGRHELLPSFDPSPPRPNPASPIAPAPVVLGAPGIPQPASAEAPSSPFPGMTPPPRATAR